MDYSRHYARLNADEWLVSGCVSCHPCFVHTVAHAVFPTVVGLEYAMRKRTILESTLPYVLCRVFFQMTRQNYSLRRYATIDTRARDSRPCRSERAPLLLSPI